MSLCTRAGDFATTRSKAVALDNAVLATAIARLKLYSYMEKLQDRLLYCDTDSCVFLASENNRTEYRPPLGTLLDDMTDELETYGAGSYIKTFACTGSTFYALEIVSGRTGETHETVKVKGVTLNFLNSAKVNFASIKQLVWNEFIETDDDDDDGKCISLKFRAIRHLPGHIFVTRDETKTCAVVLKKRIFLDEKTSIPFGFADPTEL